jgi:hypothetical protein
MVSFSPPAFCELAASTKVLFQGLKIHKKPIRSLETFRLEVCDRKNNSVLAENGSEK